MDEINKEVVPGLANQLDYEPHSTHRLNVARAVPLSLTQPHTISSSFRFRGDPWVVDHSSPDVLLTVSRLATRRASPRKLLCGRCPEGFFSSSFLFNSTAYCGGKMACCDN